MKKETFSLTTAYRTSGAPVSQDVAADVGARGHLSHENTTATPGLQPLRLGPRRDAKQQHLAYCPDVIG